MTPEIAQQDRPLRQVLIKSAPDFVYDEGADILALGHNDRGSIEVLVTEDRANAFRTSASSGSELLVSGFFRRRSGIKPNGSRGYIWTLILISWMECEELPIAA